MLACFSNPKPEKNNTCMTIDIKSIRNRVIFGTRINSLSVNLPENYLLKFVSSVLKYKRDKQQLYWSKPGKFRLWNSLPQNVRASPSLDSFNIRLKTFLYKEAFN